ncbi:hypothetical protein ACSS6W_007721 [Trichoderma asperelloides]
MASLVWLVTGCSSGFGRVFVDELLRRGDKVIATARRPESVADLKKTNATVLQLDVTWDQTRITEAINDAIGIHGHIDVLVNNAAYVLGGAWEDLSYEDFCDAFETNEVKSLGLRTLLIEPGFFRTDLLAQGNVKTVQSSIRDYREDSRAFNKLLIDKNHTQSGDPKKGVAIIVDLVRLEGVAKDKTVPLRMPLGPDAYDVIKNKCEKTINLLEDWKDVISSTDLNE